jgi:hypothetical protein
VQKTKRRKKQMKKKTSISIGVIGLLLLTAFLTPQLFAIKKVEAVLNGSVIFGTPGIFETNEAQATVSAAAAIRYYFSLTGDYIYLENYCGEDTQNTLVYSVANYLETYPYDFATIFYKGDGVYIEPYNFPYYDCHNHTVLYDNDGGAHTDRVYDAGVGLRTVNGRHDFVFLWSCGTANEEQIGGISGPNTWGMAASWLKKTDLSLDGYDDPDYSDHAFLGWQYFSKPFTDYTGHYSYTYKTFATMFYYYALVKGYTINQALNQASLNYIGKAFEQSTIYKGWWENFPGMGGWLFNQFRVWGDGTMKLP